MSSHHFVREGQEPALFIVDALASDQIMPLLEWAPLVIVHESALSEIIRWGIKIDVVIASEEMTATLASQLADQHPLKIFSQLPGDDAVNTILHFLIRTKERAVTITANDIDGLLPKLTPFVSHLNIGILTSAVRWSSVPGGKFDKWLTKGSRLHFRGATSTLFVNGEAFEKSAFLTPNDGLVGIASDSGFWVGEDL